jgi:hypothetical protein
MNPSASTQRTTPNNRTTTPVLKDGEHHDHRLESVLENVADSEQALFPVGYQISVICIYPSVNGGKLAKHWLETAFNNFSPHTSTCIEYYNLAILGHDGINWEHVIERIRPDVILLVCDGTGQLIAGLRNSLKDLIAKSSNGKKPLVIFRVIEHSPSINTSVLLDYVSALTSRNQCHLNAMNGDGAPISCFRHPRYLLKGRRHHE